MSERNGSAPWLSLEPMFLIRSGRTLQKTKREGKEEEKSGRRAVVPDDGPESVKKCVLMY